MDCSAAAAAWYAACGRVRARPGCCDSTGDTKEWQHPGRPVSFDGGKDTYILRSLCEWECGELLLGQAPCCTGNRHHQYHMPILTIAGKYTNHAEKITKSKQKQKSEKYRKGGSPFNGTWGSITKMVRLGAMAPLLVK